MTHRTVYQVMTRDVVRVAPGTGFREIATLLHEYDISAVPVVDPDERPLGVVSEADLLRVQAAQEDPSRLSPPPPAAAADAATARGLMTSPAVCTTPEASVVEAARLMGRHHLKHLPVVDGSGHLTGMVSRSDLLRVFLRGDREIRTEIVEDVLGRTAGVSPAAVGVEVDQGVVTLSGILEPPYLAKVVLRLCRAVDGVVSVVDRMNERARRLDPPHRPVPAGRPLAASAGATEEGP
ncbi:CBS domain-containing protein [Kitasatospora camelliae]|uniref:CBS domain-containing protein n=1 Tax=Kitasatospora camelliae TaxID=3156397 RepID=A0AAU8JRK0_9ACTN